MTHWIDFRELRSKLSFVDVLKHYGVEPKVKGDRAYGFCPLPSHPVRADGKKRTASLSVNLSRNIFQCFGCKASGNVLEFCARMEGFDPADHDQFRSAAVKITTIFGISTDSNPRHTKDSKPSSNQAVPPKAPVGHTDHVSVHPSSVPILINVPLDFELKHLDPQHPYLAARGFTPETIEHFGLGFCGKGMMKDRIAVPLHDAQGRLIGYAGRLVDDEQVNDENPKYLFPGSREREGKRYEFHKSELLYNHHRISRPVHDLIVVEGFASVWWLHQHGHTNVMALMGSSMSRPQGELVCDLLNPDGRLWILTDGDPAGRDCAQSIFTEVAPVRSVRWARLEEGQPTDLSADELDAILPHP